MLEIEVGKRVVVNFEVDAETGVRTAVSLELLAAE